MPMTHSPIQINNLSFSFLHKTCFEHFTTHINYGDRIAIISGSIDMAIAGRPLFISHEGCPMKRPKMTTKQKRDRRLKIKRRRIRKQKNGM